MTVVADTSALVSLGTVAQADPSPLAILLEHHNVSVPARVVSELRDTADFDDASGTAAAAVLDRLDAFDVREVDLDDAFPLDDGENAAVTLANDVGADQFLCDEFNSLALVHASLVDARLLTTPTLLTAFVRNGRLSPEAATAQLSTMRDARSWETNAYVERATETLQREK